MIAQMKRKKHAWQSRKEKRTVRVSKCGETYIEFFELYEDQDPLLYQAECSSPWISEGFIDGPFLVRSMIIT